MSKIERVDAGNPEESIRMIGHPSNAHDHLLIGEAYFLLGDYHKAVDEITQGLNETDHRSLYSSVLTSELIAAYCFLGRFDEASKMISYFGHLLDPGHLSRWQNFQTMQEWPTNETNDWMEFVVASWLETRGRKRRPDLAENLCENLVKLSPDLPKVWFNLGRACADQNKYDPAIMAFTEYLRLVPYSLDGLVSRAWCYKLSGKFQECREDIERIREIDPNDRDLGQLFDGLDAREVIEPLEQANTFEDDELSPIYALVFESNREPMKNDIAKVIDFFVRAGRLEPPSQKSRVAYFYDFPLEKDRIDGRFMVKISQKLMKFFPDLEQFITISQNGFESDGLSIDIMGMESNLGYIRLIYIKVL